MKIFVLIKQVVDPNLILSLKKDGTGFETDGLNTDANPFDLVALEAALALKDDGNADDVVAITFGDNPSDKVLRQAFAMGATRAIRLDGKGAPFDAFSFLCKQEKPDLILCGKQAVDDDLLETGPMLAADLLLPFETNVSSLDLSSGKITVSKESDHGRETLSLPLPCLLCVDLTLNTPRLATVPQILKAKSKPIEVVTFSQRYQDPRKTLSYQPVPSRPAIRMIDSLSDLSTEIAP